MIFVSQGCQKTANTDISILLWNDDYRYSSKVQPVKIKAVKVNLKDNLGLSNLQNGRLKDASIVDVSLGLAMAGRHSDDSFGVRDDAVTRLNERS